MIRDMTKCIVLLIEISNIFSVFCKLLNNKVVDLFGKAVEK